MICTEPALFPAKKTDDELSCVSLIYLKRKEDREWSLEELKLLSILVHPGHRQWCNHCCIIYI